MGDEAQTQRYESVDAESASSLVVKQGYSLLDVRTPEEYAAGHAPGAVNVPWMLQTEEGRQHNPHFLEQVRERFPNASGAHMVVACGGGTRGTSAATAIAEAGYERLLCMPGGMRAWAARGLPTTQADSPQ